MKRISTSPRPDWQQKTAKYGLLYHTNPDGSLYWDESACFQFTPAEVEQLETAANDLHEMFLEACGIAIEQKRLTELGIPEILHPLIRQSWELDEWELYGRFDFAFDGITPRLLEYNADTPTGLLEAAVVQWYWKEEQFPQADQFNSLHEKLVERWQLIRRHDPLNDGTLLYFTSVANHTEDRMTVGYLGETAEQAGFATEYLPIDQIGWKADSSCFVDRAGEPIRQIFKLYPWEWMATEPFAPHLAPAGWRTIEPAWKAVLASKALLIILQELFPQCPYLLPVSRQPLPGDFVRKPIFGREGHNVTIQREGRSESTPGRFEKDAFIYQQYAPLFQAEGNFAQVGVWMIGPEACGLGMREDRQAILGNTSRFVPHVITD